jgi:hypothetical protein
VRGFVDQLGGVLIVDETGLVEKGIARPGCRGAMGQIEDCPIGVFLALHHRARAVVHVIADLAAGAETPRPAWWISGEGSARARKSGAVGPGRR